MRLVIYHNFVLTTIPQRTVMTPAVGVITFMEHLSPGSKVIDDVRRNVTRVSRSPCIWSGRCLRQSVGHDWTAAVGHSCTAAVGQDYGTAVGQGVAVGTAHPATTSVTSIKEIARITNLLWFIFSSFEYLIGLKILLLRIIEFLFRVYHLLPGIPHEYRSRWHVFAIRSADYNSSVYLLAK